MKIVKDGGTIWGDQFAQFVKEQGISDPILYEVGAFDGKDVDGFINIFPKITAYAFEADPDTYKTYLTDKPYKTFCIALSKKNSDCYFYKYNDVRTNSLRKRLDGQNPHIIRVPVYRLDDFVLEKKLPYPTVVKIDAEGATLEILEGMGFLLNHIQVLYLETENEKVWEGQKLHKDVIKFLKNKFECVVLHDNGNQNDSLWIRK